MDRSVLSWLKYRENSHRINKSKNRIISMSFKLTDSNWQEMRLLAIGIYGRVCMKCGASGRKTVIEVDHIKPRSRHPELCLDLSNLQTLCSKCNRQKGNGAPDDYRNEGQIKIAKRMQAVIGEYIDFEANDIADKDKLEKKEKSLAYHIRCKLDMSLSEYCRIMNINLRTIGCQWQSEKGRVNVENAVFRFYMDRFHEL